MKTLVTDLRLTVLVLTLLGSLAACKKHDPDPEKNGPGFVDKHWKVSSITSTPAIDVSGDGIPDPDWMPYAPQCFIDDITTFKSNGSFVVDDGQLCDGDSPTPTNVKWTYDESSKLITLTDGTNTISYEVVEASSSVFKIKLYEEEEGVALTLIKTYKPQ
ncbi:lipocalin family protein [Cytophagaceae bacterium YF14B1]|uniref:Lipocalin family protein n=1 Tax=Xanthocytophaga flava TaxID=3048013 RepID=A0AAE3QMF6_9BACT|nr:lipocalin family protein [Xanthocytophaga flavus]MDJ1479755.1 lipocalin family protein [Xanthocytophaga flavus]